MVETTKFKRDVKKADLSKRQNNPVSLQEPGLQADLGMLMACLATEGFMSENNLDAYHGAKENRVEMIRNYVVSVHFLYRTKP